MLGKLITHEFAWGIQTGASIRPRNPGTRPRPGRLSSGSGAALAAGLRGALGTDTGGRSACRPRFAASSASSRRTAAAAAPA